MTNTITCCSRERREKEGKGEQRCYCFWILAGDSCVCINIYIYMDYREGWKRKEMQGNATSDVGSRNF